MKFALSLKSTRQEDWKGLEKSNRYLAVTQSFVRFIYIYIFKAKRTWLGIQMRMFFFELPLKS